MNSNLLRRVLERVPKPLVTFIPILFAFLVGLVLWIVAFSIPVDYPQETKAPYAHYYPHDARGAAPRS